MCADVCVWDNIDSSCSPSSLPGQAVPPRPHGALGAGQPPGPLGPQPPGHRVPPPGRQHPSPDQPADQEIVSPFPSLIFVCGGGGGGPSAIFALVAFLYLFLAVRIRRTQ